MDGLFNTREQILDACRATDLEQTESLIDSIITQTRVDIYDVLTIKTVTLLLSYPVTDEPSTQEELYRASVGLLEINLVNVALLRRLPVFSMTEVDDARELYNDDPINRSDPTEQTIAFLEEAISKAVESLLELTEDSDDKTTPRFAIF